MKSPLPEKYHTNTYYFALIILVIGMPLSKFMMSVAQIILIGNWLLEGHWTNKLISFWKNKSALILSSLLLLHFFGLLYTTNFDDGFLDVRVKFPLFALPLIISTTKPLSQKMFNVVLKFFVASVLGCTIFSSLILTDIIHRPLLDTRGISIFISHIRFSLLICVSVFISFFFFKTNSEIMKRIFWFVAVVWLFVFLILMESMTGIGILATTCFILLIYKILKWHNKLLNYGMILSIICSVIFIANLFLKHTSENNIPLEQIDFSKVEDYTSRGNAYKQNKFSNLTENGNLIWINFCPEELREEWNKRSKIDYDGKDIKGNYLSFTLLRFLTSKGLKKDGDAVKSLSDEEIKAIERGVPNANYQNVNGLSARIYETLWEIDLYNKTGDANGHSLTQRFEYWKTSLLILKDNPLLGVGTGDLQLEFDKKYHETNSKLNSEYRLRSHNQYLSIAVAFGLVGLLWFLFTLIYPLIQEKKSIDFLYISFFIIVVLSFISEDTLETQAGVTFYAFLNSFFLFGKEK